MCIIYIYINLIFNFIFIFILFLTLLVYTSKTIIFILLKFIFGFFFIISHTYLLEILRHNNGIHRTGAEVGQKQSKKYGKFSD